MIKTLKKVLIKIKKRNTRQLREKYPKYTIGRGTYGNPEILDWKEGATLSIGAFCSIAAGVKIYLGGEHRIDWITTYPFSVLWESGFNIQGHPKTKGNIVIGNDVWIGADAKIMSGVTIGDGAVIGASSVITKNVEPYAIYAGNPARLIRMRFEKEVVTELLEIKWWEFTDEIISRILPLLLSADSSC